MTHHETTTAKLIAYNLPHPDAHGYVYLSTDDSGLFLRQFAQLAGLGFEPSESHHSLAMPYWIRLHHRGWRQEPAGERTLVDAHAPEVSGAAVTLLPATAPHFARNPEIRCIERSGQEWFSAGDICRQLGIGKPTSRVAELSATNKAQFDLGRNGFRPLYVTSAGASQLAVIAARLAAWRKSHARKAKARGRRKSLAPTSQGSVTVTESRSMTFPIAAQKLLRGHAGI